jgi:hypothetical protein
VVLGVKFETVGRYAFSLGNAHIKLSLPSHLESELFVEFGFLAFYRDVFEPKGSQHPQMNPELVPLHEDTFQPTATK